MRNIRPGFKKGLFFGLLNAAFETITFTSASKTSSPKVLAKRIFNTVFDKNIITSEQDGNNNYKLTISDEIHESIACHRRLARLRV